MSNITLKLPSLFFFLFLCLGIFGVYYFHPLVYASQSSDIYVDKVYLWSTFLALSVAFYFLFVEVNGAEKKDMNSKTYDAFIPPSIIVAFIFFLPLDAVQSIRLCYVYLVFFALGHIINDKKELPHIIQIQYAWLCLFSGIGFIIFPSFIVFLPILLISCKFIFKNQVWLAFNSVVVLYLTPLIIAISYVWLAEDYFSFLDYFTNLFVIEWGVFQQAIKYFSEMNVFKQYYMTIFFGSVFVYFIINSLINSSNLLLNLLVLYCLLTLVFFAKSSDDFIWSSMNMAAILFTYVGIKTSYYRLVSVLIVVTVLLMLVE